MVRLLKQRGRRLVERRERRRATLLRRKPDRLVRDLGRARSILVLCQGNVIRSVFAAQLLTQALREVRTIAIRSAGLSTRPGWQPHPRVIARCQALSIDVSRHASAPVTAAMLEAADLVLVMEVPQLVDVTRELFSARRKVFLLSSLAPDVPLEIADPAGKDDATVDLTLDHIARALGPMIEIIAGAHVGPRAATA
jgi:protein-tyrosine phosphatase